MTTGAGRQRIDWDAAFTFYAGLGGLRSYRRVSQKFQVSRTAVRKAAARFDWDERVAKIDRETTQAVDARVTRSRADRVADTIRLVDDVLTPLLHDLELGQLEYRLADFPNLMKLAELLEGHATDRVAVSEAQALIVLIVKSFDEHLVAVLEKHVEERAQIVGAVRAEMPALLEQAAGEIGL